MVSFFGILYIEYIGPIIGIIIIGFIMGYFYKKSQSGRIGLENIKIE